MKNAWTIGRLRGPVEAVREYRGCAARYHIGMVQALRDWLLVRAPDGAERWHELSSGPVRIGRSRGSDVVLGHEQVSGTHAELVEQDAGRLVRDLGSTNGTMLNGQPLVAGAWAVLRDGDSLGIGPYSLTYGTEPAPTFAGAIPDDGAGPRLARPPSRRRGLRALVRSLLLAAATVALLVGLLWLLLPPRRSVLVLGSDARPDEIRRGLAGRTDTILAVVAERPPSGAALVSIPRDLWVPITGYGEERINAAYALGGSEAARRTAGDQLGVPIDRSVLIGLQGVRDIVDAAGGVDIDVEEPIHDDAYPTDDYGTIVVDIPAGRQHMDGETALRYARTRHQDSDFGRAARQQRVLVALRAAMLQPGNWWRAPAVLEATRRSTQTDLNPLDLAALGLSLAASPGELDRLAIGPPLVQPFSGADGAYLLRAGPGLRRSVAILLAPAEASVEVLNATSTAGLAKQAVDRLRDGGFRAARFADAARSQSASAIEVRSGGARAGRRVATILGLSPEAVRESFTLPDDLDVRVILGR